MKAENIDCWQNVNHIHLILHNLQSVFCKVIGKKLLFEAAIFQRFNGVVCVCDTTFKHDMLWVKGNFIQIGIYIFQHMKGLGKRAWEPLSLLPLS